MITDKYFLLSKSLYLAETIQEIELAIGAISTSSSGGYAFDAVISYAASPFSGIARAYGFNARDTVPAEGELWRSKLAIWFVSDGITISKRHIGFELNHTSRFDGERIDFLMIDEGGNLSWADPFYTSVGTSVGTTVWCALSGNDGNTGLSQAQAVLSPSVAHTILRTNWTNMGDNLVWYSSGIHTTTDSSLWSFDNGGGGKLAGRLIWAPFESGDTAISGNNFSVVMNPGGAVTSGGFLLSGMNVSGNWRLGDATPSSRFIQTYVNTTTAKGYNITFLDAEIGGFYSLFETAATPIGFNYIPSGAFDFLQFENCKFRDCAAYHMFIDHARYFGLWNVSSFNLGGVGTGSTLRMNAHRYVSIHNLHSDRTGCPGWTSNILRMNGGTSSTPEDITKFVSISELQWLGTNEGIEFDVVSTNRAFFKDVWVNNCYLPLSSTGAANAIISFGGGGSAGVDAERVRFTNVGGTSLYTSPLYMVISQLATEHTEKVRSIMIEGGLMYAPIVGGSNSPLILNCNGHANNYLASCIEIYSTIGINDDPTLSHVCSFMNIPSSSVIRGSNGNFLARSHSSGGIPWLTNGTASLAAWQASGFDLNSSAGNSLSHNLVSTNILSFNPSPNSSSGPQIGNGLAGYPYFGKNFTLRDPSNPDCGITDFADSGDIPDPI